MYDKTATPTTDTFPFLYDYKSTDTNTTSSPFEWYKLGCNQTADCGYHKCFYPSRHAPEEIGYLLATNSDKNPNRISIGVMNAGWRVAEHLRTSYHQDDPSYVFRHLLAGPPVNMAHLTESDVRYLNGGCAREVIKSQSKTLRNRYTTHHPVVVQPTRVVKSPYLIVGCADDKASRMFKRWQFFVQNRRNTTLEEFSAQFSSDLVSLRRITDSFPLYWNDFQVIVTPTGHIWHFDMDRFFLSNEFVRSNNVTAMAVDAAGTAFFGLPPNLAEQRECNGMLSALDRWARRVAKDAGER